MITPVSEEYPRPKVWRYPKLLSEHAFDKLRLLDCTLAEFEAAIEHAEVIEEHVVDDAGSLKELVLVVDWTRPLHLVVVVDERRQGGTDRDRLRTRPGSLVSWLP